MATGDWKTRVEDEARLRALRDTGVLDSHTELVFDRLTGLVRRLLGVPVSLVSLVDRHRQFFKSAIGLPEPWASARETPLSHSFCKHVVGDDTPLLVADAREHPMLRDNAAITELSVVAYAGMPLRTPEGHVLGSLCAIDSSPRVWSDDELATLADLAAIASDELALRRRARAADLRAGLGALFEDLGAPEAVALRAVRAVAEGFRATTTLRRRDGAIARSDARADARSEVDIDLAARNDGTVHAERDGDDHLLAQPLLRDHDGRDDPWGALVLRRASPFDDIDRELLADVAQRIVLATSAAEAFVAERTARELAERVTRSRDALIAAMSHDLRGPLNALSIAVEGIREAEAGGEDRELFEGAAVRSIARMQRLLDQLLDYAQLELGRLPVERTPLPVGRLFEAVCCELQPLAAREGFELRCASCDEMLLGDEQQLYRVLANLVTNAVKHAHGGSWIEVSCRTVSESELHIEVADDGPGVPAEQRTRIFEAFERGTRARARDGVGLGLAIAQLIVRQHGGRMWLSEHGAADGGTRGARFVFSVQRAA